MVTKTKENPTKIEPFKVKSDDCVVTVGGREYRPHVGEWIEIIPGLTVRELDVMQALKAVETQMAAIDGDADQSAQEIVIIKGSLDEVIGLLKRRVVKWNWTDDTGAKHPQPVDRPDVFTDLHTHEVYYLASVVMGEAPDAEKNG